MTDRTLPPPQSDLARDLLKDPYNFDFLTLGEDAHERHLEAGLLAHIREFLLELGQSFAFVGSQYPLTVGANEFFIDLLFYCQTAGRPGSAAHLVKAGCYRYSFVSTPLYAV